MHKNFSLKFKLSDIFIIAISLVISIVLIVVVLICNNPYSERKFVEIYHQNVLLEKYKIELNSLTKQETIVLRKSEFPRLLGDFTIYIDSKKGIKVDNITCPNHSCEKQRWVNVTNLPILCIPNDVRIVITTNNYDGSDVIGGVFYEEKFIY